MTIVEYQGCFQKVMWAGWVSDDNINGKTKSNRLMQALQIRLLNQPPGMKIIYDVRFPRSGWEGTVSNGTTAGKTDDPDKYIDAVFIDLTDRPISNKNLAVFYRVYAKDKQAWTNYVSNGKALSASGGIEAIEIYIDET